MFLKEKLFSFRNEKGVEQVGIIMPKEKIIHQVSDIFSDKKI